MTLHKYYILITFKETVESNITYLTFSYQKIWRMRESGKSLIHLTRLHLNCLKVMLKPLVMLKF